jgi:hypothetical protein
MGVYTNNYVIIGYDLMPVVNKMNPDQLDVFLEDMEELADNKGLNFIFDGMSGEYCFIGKVLNEGDDEEGMPIKKHLYSDLDMIRDEVFAATQELKMQIKDRQFPALYSFTHWH